MATIRIECSADGFEENWIEYSAAWTRGDTKRLDGAGDEGEILELITSKVVRCHIVTAGGRVIDDGAMLTPDDVDEMDEVLAQWIVASIYRMIGVKRSLGNLSALPSSPTNGSAKTVTQKNPATETA